MGKLEYVWVCKKCLRVSSIDGGGHATAPDKYDYCNGKFIKKPIW